MALAPLVVYSLSKTEENTVVTEEIEWVVTAPLYENNGAFIRRC